MVLIAYAQNPRSISKMFTARTHRGPLVRPFTQYSVYKYIHFITEASQIVVSAVFPLYDVNCCKLLYLENVFL